MNEKYFLARRFSQFVVRSFVACSISRWNEEVQLWSMLLISQNSWCDELKRYQPKFQELWWNILRYRQLDMWNVRELRATRAFDPRSFWENREKIEAELSSCSQNFVFSFVLLYARSPQTFIICWSVRRHIQLLIGECWLDRITTLVRPLEKATAAESADYVLVS